MIHVVRADSSNIYSCTRILVYINKIKNNLQKHYLDQYISRWKAEDLFVRLGEYDFKRSNESRSYNFRVVDVRQHVNFELASYHNDIAILKLDRPATFNTYVWPICLPPLGLELTNETAVVIGMYSYCNHCRVIL